MKICGYEVENENLAKKINASIERFKAFEPGNGYYLAFSGGKDSQCIYHLAKMAGVKFQAEYRVTSVDPPELVRFIKQQYPDVKIAVPHDKEGNIITMWNLIPKKLMPPTRLVRYCCEKLKESGGKGKLTVTGVRWAESNRRKLNQGLIGINTKSKKLRKQAEEIEGSKTEKERRIILNLDNEDSRRMVEQCFRTNKTLLNPIIDWEDDDVWEFLNNVLKVPHCKLYDEGYDRLGCIGCPINATNQASELKKYPKYANLYLKAFDKMIKKRVEKEMPVDWKNAEEVMEWWTHNNEWR